MLALSATYKILSSPFYAGILDRYGDWRVGRKHEPMVTLDEFNRVQEFFGHPGRPKPVTHAFAYTGLIRCACGLSITAEEKVKPSGRHYTYYHCTRRAWPQCNHPAVRVEAIEE